MATVKLSQALRDEYESLFKKIIGTVLYIAKAFKCQQMPTTSKLYKVVTKLTLYWAIGGRWNLDEILNIKGA